VDACQNASASAPDWGAAKIISGYQSPEDLVMLQSRKKPNWQQLEQKSRSGQSGKPCLLFGLERERLPRWSHKLANDLKKDAQNRHPVE